MRLAGLFVLLMAAVLWILLASSLLDAVRGSRGASVLATVTATPAPVETTAPTSTATPVIPATPAPAGTVTPRPSPTPQTIAAQTYTVAPGDNLTKIAREFGVTIEALQEANGISDPSALRAGQELTIPAH